MVVSTLFPRQSSLDSKRCWKLWWRDGHSLGKASIQLESEGTISPYTGKRYTPTAIRYQAWLWALKEENHQEAYEDVREGLSKKGRVFTQEEWKRVMVENARFVWGQTPKNVEKFIKQFHLEEYAN